MHFLLVFFSQPSNYSKTYTGRPTGLQVENLKFNGLTCVSYTKRAGPVHIGLPSSITLRLNINAEIVSCATSTRNMASAVQHNQPDRLTQIFNGLKNRNPDVRAQAAEDLTRFVGHIRSPSASR